jgi:3-hydroxyacyl-[acyl-carrier-protein] dehydratase
LPVNVEQIQQLLPHRYPFLLVDRVIEIVPDVSVVALKNVTINEPFFQGTFPGHPVMPGVLIVEAMAQTAGLLTQISSRSKANAGSPLFYLVKVDNARFNAAGRAGRSVAHGSN